MVSLIALDSIIHTLVLMLMNGTFLKFRTACLYLAKHSLLITLSSWVVGKWNVHQMNMQDIYKHVQAPTKLPQTILDYFIKHSQVHNYPTRNAQDYSINKAKKVFPDQATRTTGPTLWNSLDSKLKYCKTAKHFRNKFKSSLVNIYD